MKIFLKHKLCFQSININKMIKANRTLSWLSINNQLINCLKTKTNHKYSRYDAFIWLLENILTKVNKDGKQPLTSFSASYIRLADEWKWTRQTVQKFIEELKSLSLISTKREGNAYTFSITDELKSKIILE